MIGRASLSLSLASIQNDTVSNLLRWLMCSQSRRIEQHSEVFCFQLLFLSASHIGQRTNNAFPHTLLYAREERERAPLEWNTIERAGTIRCDRTWAWSDYIEIARISFVSIALKLLPRDHIAHIWATWHEMLVVDFDKYQSRAWVEGKLKTRNSYVRKRERSWWWAICNVYKLRLL